MEMMSKLCYGEILLRHQNENLENARWSRRLNDLFYRSKKSHMRIVHDIIVTKVFESHDANEKLKEIKFKG